MKALKWEYCECGCHGSTFDVGANHYWLLNDLNGGYHLHRGHGWMSLKIGTYTSSKEADAVVRKELLVIKKVLDMVLGNSRTRSNTWTEQ